MGTVQGRLQEELWGGRIQQVIQCQINTIFLKILPRFILCIYNILRKFICRQGRLDLDKCSSLKICQCCRKQIEKGEGAKVIRNLKQA